MNPISVEKKENKIEFLAEVELVRLLYRNAYIAIIGSGLSSFILFGVMWMVIPHGLSILWFAVLWALSLVRLLMARRFRRSRAEGEEVLAWGRRFTWEAMTAGILWGSSSVLLFIYGPQVYYQFSILILAGLSAASVITHAPVLKAYLAYMIPVLTVPIIGLLWKHAPFDLAVAGLTLIFMGAMYILSRQINSILRRELELRFTNEELAGSLRVSEEQFRGAFETSSIGMTLVNPEGGFIRVNPSLCSIVGYSKDELIKKSFQEIAYPDDLETDLEYKKKLLAGELSYYHLEKRYIHKTGKVVWIMLSVSLVRDIQGQPLYFVSQFEDISERKLAEGVVRKSHAQLAAAQRIAHMGSWEWNAILNEVHPSEELCRILRIYPSESTTLDKILDRIAPDDRERFRLTLDHVREGNVSYSIEFRLLRPDGSEGIVEAYIEPLRDAENKVIGTSGTLQEITGRRQLEETTKKALAEEERLKAINTLAMTYAHHLLNALTPVQGFAELISKHTEASDNTHRWSESIIVNAKRAADIVNQLRKASGYTIKQIGGIEILDIKPPEPDKK